MYIIHMHISFIYMHYIDVYNPRVLSKINHCSYKKYIVQMLHSRFPAQELRSCPFLCCTVSAKSWINTGERRGCLYRVWRISPSYPQRQEPQAGAPCCCSTTNIVTVTWKANPGSCSARIAQEIVTSVIRHKKKFLLSLSSWVQT